MPIPLRKTVLFLREWWKGLREALGGLVRMPARVE